MTLRMRAISSVMLVIFLVSSTQLSEARPSADTYRWWGGVYSQQPFSRGVSGMIMTPPSSAYVAPSEGPNAADIFLRATSGREDFVQVGWYVGQPGGLPMATVPRAFYGEQIPGTNNETLRAGPVLGWGTHYLFRIDPVPGATGYRFWINNTFHTSTLYGHAPYMTAAFNGETYNCSRMDARAYRNQTPLAILMYMLNDNTWHWFYDFEFTQGENMSQHTPVGADGIVSSKVSGQDHTNYSRGISILFCPR